jgi:excisionase family DNA binding protein
MDFKHAYTVRETCDTLSVGKTKLYKLISSGQLQAHHLGRRTLIMGDSLRDFLTALPVAAHKSPRLAVWSKAETDQRFQERPTSGGKA